MGLCGVPPSDLRLRRANWKYALLKPSPQSPAFPFSPTYLYIRLARAMATTVNDQEIKNIITATIEREKKRNINKNLYNKTFQASGDQLRGKISWFFFHRTTVRKTLPPMSIWKFIPMQSEAPTKERLQWWYFHRGRQLGASRRSSKKQDKFTPE